ncbi:MAG: SWIM zinc finger family protein [Cyanobacteria bacterium]|nr:SWIM zinc finger family protein [Cyanobacteriota bacterium]
MNTGGGMPARRKRGEPLASQWWSQRFTAVLEGYGLGPRMERGRRYARGGRVQELVVKAGRLEARVQGSRATPYRVSIRIQVPRKEQWLALEAAFARRLGWAARLLAGELPMDLEAAFAAAGVALFPHHWEELEVRCGCPDDAKPCKHIAAALYVFAQQLDADPWLLLAWHGRERQALLKALQQVASTGAGPATDAEALPPWWPAGLRARPDPRSQPPAPLPPDPPERALQRLGPLELPEAPADLEHRLAALYRQWLGLE